MFREHSPREPAPIVCNDELVSVAIHGPVPGLKGKTLKLWVLNRWVSHLCVRMTIRWRSRVTMRWRCRVTDKRRVTEGCRVTQRCGMTETCRGTERCRETERCRVSERWKCRMSRRYQLTMRRRCREQRGVG